MTPVNSIEIPDRFVDIAEAWHSGVDCMLYAVSSTGGLTTGTDCPVTDYTDRDDRDRKWYLHLWRELSIDIGDAGSFARSDDDDDAGLLDDFEYWIDDICDRLADEYGLTEWEGCDG